MTEPSEIELPKLRSDSVVATSVAPSSSPSRPSAVSRQPVAITEAISSEDRILRFIFLYLLQTDLCPSGCIDSLRVERHVASGLQDIGDPPRRRKTYSNHSYQDS